MGEYRISELEKKANIQPTDLLVVEDNDDTKNCTVLDFLRSITSGDMSGSNGLYSAEEIDSIIRNLQITLSGSLGADIESIRNTLNNILKTTSKTPLPGGKSLCVRLPAAQSSSGGHISR